VPDEKVLLTQIAEQQRLIAATLSKNSARVPDNVHQTLRAAQAFLQQAAIRWQCQAEYRTAAGVRMHASREKLVEVRRELRKATVGFVKLSALRLCPAINPGTFALEVRSSPDIGLLFRGNAALLPTRSCENGPRLSWPLPREICGKSGFLTKLFVKDNRMREAKEQSIEVEGHVQTVLPGTMFRVELDNKHVVLATICGKMRKRWVRLTVGDRVKMEMSPYDLDKARITWRLR
jgi:translation initiation factor IF-1